MVLLLQTAEKPVKGSKYKIVITTSLKIFQIMENFVVAAFFKVDRGFLFICNWVWVVTNIKILYLLTNIII